MSIHPKIQALKNNVGTSPIKFFNAKSPIEASRAAKVENDRLIKMYHAVWGVPDDFGTVPVQGCFSKSIEERGPNSKSNFKIVVLWQHDQRDPIGRPSVLVEDEIGLYAEYEPDDVPSGNRAITQVRSGTINQGSYGFNYVWDKMEYDDNSGLILMKECNMFEISPVTIGSQRETFAVRSSSGEFVDAFLTEETEDFIKSVIPRKHHLEIRSLINRHISLAKMQPLETREALPESKPTQGSIDWDFLINNLKN